MHDFIDPILPGGIVGIGKMLCSIRESGALHRLFWPGIDWGQHMGILKTGIQYDGGAVRWLDDSSMQSRQHYLEDTNILVTSITDLQNNTEIQQTDLVLPEDDVLVRTYRVINNGGSPRNINIIAYCSFSIEESNIHDGMYYLSDQQALIQYRRSIFLGVKCPGRTPYGYHCGRRNSPSDPFEAACRGEFWRCPDNIKSGAGSMGWSLGSLNPGGQTSATLAIAAAHNENSLTELLNLPVFKDQSTVEITSQYWKKWLSRREDVNTDTTLYKRSLLSMKIMSDRTGGASVAAPEFDSHYLASGGYGYCWPRDGMFVALALDEAGHHDEAGMFYKYAARVQKPEGNWHQRYFMNGDRASTWGEQIDQTGAVLWGYHHHYTLTGESGFLNHIWPSVYSGAGYLVKNRLDNGLQIPTMDLWEDEFAQSTYASAAVYGGLKGAAKMAAAMGDSRSENLWNEAAESIKESILLHQWDGDLGSFTRSANRRVSEGEYHRARECGQGVCQLTLPGTQNSYNALSLDRRIDTALLGLCYPFGVLPAADQRMQSTAETIENNLFNSQVGGIHRYQGDSYAGGNPWVLASLWMSIYHSLGGQKEKAAEYLHWAQANASRAGLLPEQVHRHNGGPAWVLPLNWSHAMYVLATLAITGRLSSMNKLALAGE